MTNWAPDYTPRGIIHYTSAGVPHTFTGRSARGTPSATVVGEVFQAFDDLVTALTTILCDDFAITAMFYIAEDTNIQIPVTPAPVLTTGGAVPIANMSTMDKATQLVFPGKSNGGLKARVSILGMNLTMDNTTETGQTHGRITAAESALVADAVAALQDSNLVANDNFPVSWYEYATNKVNDYWWKQARKTGGL